MSTTRVVYPTAAMLLVSVSGALGIDPGVRCARTKQQAAARKVGANVKCSERTSGDVQTCLAKAEQKFAAAFQKAEAIGGCATNNDADAIEEKVDNFVTDLLDALPATTTTSTTTSTMPTTTTLPNLLGRWYFDGAVTATACPDINPVGYVACAGNHALCYFDVLTQNGTALTVRLAQTVPDFTGTIDLDAGTWTWGPCDYGQMTVTGFAAPAPATWTWYSCGGGGNYPFSGTVTR